MVIVYCLELPIPRTGLLNIVHRKPFRIEVIEDKAILNSNNKICLLFSVRIFQKIRPPSILLGMKLLGVELSRAAFALVSL